MDFSLSRDSLAAIVALIAPGYLAIQVYSAVYSKARKDFSQLLLESVVYGLLIASVYNACLRLSGVDTFDVLSIRYYLPLLIIAPLAGLAASYIRRWRPIRSLATRLDLPGPDDDYLRDRFKQLPPDAIVTVTLKSGEIFSGTPESLSAGQDTNRPEQKLTFGNLAWYTKRKRGSHWEVRPGNLIITAGDILFIETDEPLTK